MGDNNLAQAGSDSRLGAEQEARNRLEAYLKPIYADPLNDERKLSARGACAAMGMSYNTLVKYGLEKRLVAAQEHRDSKRAEAWMEPAAPVDLVSGKHDRCVARLCNILPAVVPGCLLPRHFGVLSARKC